MQLNREILLRVWLERIQKMKNALTNPRTALAILHDIVATAIAWVAAYLLRFNFDIPLEHIKPIWQNAIWIFPLQLILFVNFGLYRGVWRFASLPDFKRIIKAIAVATLTLATVLLFFKPFGMVPRSVLVLDPILLIMLMGGSRFAYRAWVEHSLFGSKLKQGTPVIILGAGDAAISLVKDLERSAKWSVFGLLDDDVAMVGREIQGVKVLGKVNYLTEIHHRFDVKHVIVAMPLEHHKKRRQVIDYANQLGFEVLTVPPVADLLGGKLTISQIRKVDIEDLLGRDTVKLDTFGLHELICGHNVFVSGAGGSIGSELCRQILKYKPDTLICFDVSEYALYKLEQEFSQQDFTINLLYLTGDVKNTQRIANILAQHKPSVVFHAAAYKHVPLMENCNVWEALSNNVIGTYTLARACKAAGVEKFVLISTDKAVNPTNVMGATKRLAEMVCQGMQDDVGTSFVIVRFGNVLGSSGSVIPKFREQIAKGGPLTITHPDITRYFMSIPEAAQLVMQAGLMGNGGEILVLDMGEPVKIANLAADMIKLSGLQLEDIKIEYVGLRPGEKLYEELLTDDEHTQVTPHEKLRIALARPVDQIWVDNLLLWINSVQNTDEVEIKNDLKLWVEEYQPAIVTV